MWLIPYKNINHWSSCIIMWLLHPIPRAHGFDASPRAPGTSLGPPALGLYLVPSGVASNPWARGMGCNNHIIMQLDQLFWLLWWVNNILCLNFPPFLHFTCFTRKFSWQGHHDHDGPLSDSTGPSWSWWPSQHRAIVIMMALPVTQQGHHDHDGPLSESTGPSFPCSPVVRGPSGKWRPCVWQ